MMEDDHIEEVQLDLEVEEPPAPTPKPDAVTETDAATEAFVRLEGEMAMVRHTVQNMARERADIVIPDYTATLGQMADQLEQVSDRLGAIADKPAMKLTPETITDQIANAAEGSRRYDSDQLMKAQNFHRQATAEMHALAGRARTIEEQNRKKGRNKDEVGIRLIRSQNPEAWEELATAQRVLSSNRDAWERCVDRSRKEERLVSCSIQLKPRD